MGFRPRAMEEMVMNREFWRDRRVFLTGHTGFKGSWLSLWLQFLGAKVTGYATDPPTNPSLFELARVNEGMKSIIGDIRDIDLLRDAYQSAEPEIVIHMAAQPLVRQSYVNPIETYNTNVIGTLNLLEVIRNVGGPTAVVNITTDKCYANREWVWGYREDEPLGGHDPYSSSKACSELVTASYRNSFFNNPKDGCARIALATARAGNVIGGGDWAKDRLIPDILTGFQLGDTVRIRNPEAIRPWQHVLDPLRGYLMLAERLYKDGNKYAEGWNFGPRDEDSRPVSWIVARMASYFGPDAKWTIDDGAKPHEASYLKLDISKAVNRLGWSPILSLDQSISLIMEWSYSMNIGKDVKALTCKQIEDYLLLL